MEQTNFEKLKALSPEEFWREICTLQNKPLFSFTDFPAWLDSTDADLMHFVRTIGNCKVYPSEAEMLCAGCKTDADKGLYRQTHCREMLLLEETKLYGEPYYTVTDAQGTMIQKVPNLYLKIYLHGKEGMQKCQ